MSGGLDDVHLKRVEKRNLSTAYYQRMVGLEPGLRKKLDERHAVRSAQKAARDAAVVEDGAVDGEIGTLGLEGRKRKRKRKRKSDREDGEKSGKKRRRAEERRGGDGDGDEDASATPDVTPLPWQVGSKKKRKSEADNHDTSPEIQQDERSTKKAKTSKPQHDTTSLPTTTTTTTTPSQDDLLTTHTPFHTQTSTLYLPLSPTTTAFPLHGLCAEHLSPLLLTYFPPLHGIVLAYSNPRITSQPPPQTPQAKTSSPDEDGDEALGQCIDEFPTPFAWLTASFLLFRPQKGTYLEGYVSLQNESLLGLVCYNYFNAVIARDKLPEGWRWVGVGVDDVGGGKGGKGRRVEKGGKDGRRREFGEGSGWFVDAAGEKVEGRVVFRVEDFEVGEGGGVC